MRLKAEMWVMAYVRRLNGEGVPAMIVRRGDEDAGAIYIKIATLDGSAALYGPAPAGLDSARSDRSWIAVAKAGTPEREIDDRIEKERSFDPDLWLIEVEDRLGRSFLDGWLANE
jgi:hypothetical protein